MNRIGNLEKKYAKEVLDKNFSTSSNNIYLKKLEKEFASKFQRRDGIGFNSGTSALHVALKSLDISKGDEVIVPPLTMSAPALAVNMLGATPVFCDIEQDTLNINPKSCKKLISSKTRAIIAVSLYGLPANLIELKKICKKNNLFLIEDNAECLLGKCENKLAGSFGDFSMFSFQASKHITCGNGGILIGDSERLINKARSIGNLGYGFNLAKKKIFTKQNLMSNNFIRHHIVGFNYRLPELNAAVAYAQLQRIDELVAARVNSGEKYFNFISKYKNIRSQLVPKSYTHTYWCFPIIFKTKKLLIEFLKIWKKNSSLHFYGPWKLNYREPALIKYSKKVSCPVAENIQPRILQFPTNFYNNKEVDVYLKAIEKCMEKLN